MLNLHGDAIEKLLKISQGALCLIVVLGNYGTVSHPSKKVLMSKLKIKDPKTLKKLENSVVKAGFLKIEERIGQSKRYTILLDGISKFNGQPSGKNGGGGKMRGVEKTTPVKKWGGVKNTLGKNPPPLIIESNTIIESNKEKVIIESIEKTPALSKNQNSKIQKTSNHTPKNQSSEDQKKLRKKKVEEAPGIPPMAGFEPPPKSWLDMEIEKRIDALDFCPKGNWRDFTKLGTDFDNWGHNLQSAFLDWIFHLMGKDGNRYATTERTICRKVQEITDFLAQYTSEQIADGLFFSIDKKHSSHHPTWKINHDKKIKQDEQGINDQQQSTSSKKRATSTNKIEFGSRTKNLLENGNW